MGAVMNSTTLASETNEPTKWIEMKEIPKLQMCQYCHMTIHNDEVYNDKLQNTSCSYLHYSHSLMKFLVLLRNPIGAGQTEFRELKRGQ